MKFLVFGGGKRAKALVEMQSSGGYIGCVFGMNNRIFKENRVLEVEEI